jgi:hypothetical protein
MMALHDFPRCAAYLKAMRFRLDDEAMTDYGWAVALSENWTDEFLVADGRVNFDTMDGAAILTEFERLFREGQATGGKGEAHGLSHPDMEALKAYFGSRGIKASRLKSDDDFWIVAHILWPSHVGESQRGPLRSLLTIIRGMSKKERQTARGRVQHVPARYLAPSQPMQVTE